MSTLSQIRKEITDLTAAMIEVGLSLDQNFPSEKTHVGEHGPIIDLSVSNADEVSVALKQRPYLEIYNSLLEKRAYNLRLIDGALVQFRYRFQENKLLKHVLAFYPSPNLLDFQNYPELYETELMYADIVQRDIVTVPLRFDYDETNFVEDEHPMSHFTLGQYKNCRLAVSNALTPHRFLRFILRAFYNTPFVSYCREWKGTAADFPRSVTAVEATDLHLGFNQ